MNHRGIDGFSRQLMIDYTHEAMATTLAGDFPKPFFVVIDRQRKRVRFDVPASDAPEGTTLATAAANLLVPALRRKNGVTAGVVLCAKYSPHAGPESDELPSTTSTAETYALIFLADRMDVECLRATVTEREEAHPICGDFEAIAWPDLDGPMSILRAAFKLAGLS